MRHPSTTPLTSLQAHLDLKILLLKRKNLSEITHLEFIRGWAAIAFIAPCLRADEALHEDGGWPEAWKLIAEEAFRRAKAGELTQEELFPALVPVKKPHWRCLAA